MRANQVWKFYYKKGYSDPNLFSNLTQSLRDELSKNNKLFPDLKLKINKYQKMELLNGY